MNGIIVEKIEEIIPFGEMFISHTISGI